MDLPVAVLDCVLPSSEEVICQVFSAFDYVGFDVAVRHLHELLDKLLKENGYDLRVALHLLVVGLILEKELDGIVSPVQKLL